MWILVVCVLFAGCLLLCLFFLLKLFALQNRLRKAHLQPPGFVFCFVVCLLNLQNHSGNGLQLPALGKASPLSYTSTSLGAKNDVIVCVPFVTL